MSTPHERHPEVQINKHEDPRNRRRTVPMEVLSLGFSRTGTMTMKAALEILGLPTWHWLDLAMWTEALKAKFENGKPFGREEFDNLLGKWSATTDWPASFMAEELVSNYPEAKVILVERDLDQWYNSYSETVIKGVANPFVPLGCMINKDYLRQMRDQAVIVAKHCFNVPGRPNRGLMNNSEFFATWKANAKRTYMAHNENVKQITPKDRLLLFQLNQGWVPLCSFLGRPVPDVAFPRVNETAAVQEKINLYINQSFKRSGIQFAKRAGQIFVVLLAVLLWWNLG